MRHREGTRSKFDLGTEAARREVFLKSPGLGPHRDARELASRAGSGLSFAVIYGRLIDRAWPAFVSWLSARTER